MDQSAVAQRNSGMSGVQRVLHLEALVDSQADLIEALETQLAEVGTRSGQYWEFGDDFGMAPAVRQRRSRDR